MRVGGYDILLYTHDKSSTHYVRVGDVGIIIKMPHAYFEFKQDHGQLPKVVTAISYFLIVMSEKSNIRYA